MSQLEPPYPLIRDGLREGRVIPFLGSGASLGGRKPDANWTKGMAEYLPTAGELAKYLAHMTAFPQDESPDLTKVAQYYDVVVGRDPLEEKLHEIFEVFRQVDSGDSRVYGGLGLGLGISARLASLLGANLAASSEEGKGAVFSLIIPGISDETLEPESAVYLNQYAITSE